MSLDLLDLNRRAGVDLNKTSHRENIFVGLLVRDPVGKSIFEV